MDVTISNQSSDRERTCINCGSLFVATNAKHKFCSGTCKTANHRQEKKELVSERENVVQQQQVELDKLRKAPVTRIESVREVNPVWQLAQQRYQAQQAHYYELKQQTSLIHQEIDQLRKSGKGVYIGASAGVACVLLWMAVRYDTRQRKPLGVTFTVAALILLIMLGSMGQWIGKQFDDQIRKNDVDAGNRLSELGSSYNGLNEQLSTEKIILEQMRIALNNVPKYNRETVTSVDELQSLDVN